MKAPEDHTSLAERREVDPASEGFAGREVFSEVFSGVVSPLSHFATAIEAAENPEVARMILRDLDHGCEECAAGVFGAPGAASLLVALMHVAGLRGSAESCPDLRPFAEGVVDVPTALRQAVHVASCGTCADAFESLAAEGEKAEEQAVAAATKRILDRLVDES